MKILDNIKKALTKDPTLLEKYAIEEHVGFKIKYNENYPLAEFYTELPEEECREIVNKEYLNAFEARRLGQLGNIELLVKMGIFESFDKIHIEKLGRYVNNSMMLCHVDELDLDRERDYYTES